MFVRTCNHPVRDVGTEVGLVRAQGLPHETVLYGLEVQRDEWEGAFEIDTSSGEITVGPNGSEILVIVRTLLTKDNLLLPYSYWYCYPSRMGYHCPLPSRCSPTTKDPMEIEYDAIVMYYMSLYCYRKVLYYYHNMLQ